MSGYYPLDVSELIKQNSGGNRQPFPHQKEAFSALSKTLPLPIKGYRGTLLVLPTGGGKTYTSVNWICRNVLTKSVKVLWLAQSSYLLDQAAKSFRGEMHHAVGRDIVNVRVVSSSTEHSNAGSISITDDVLICTTQTAISAYSSEQLDGRGRIVKTPFRNYVDSCIGSELFVVIDEAHHTPAYGCRNLLRFMQKDIPNLYILGLTATPMHMDKRISGWLKTIFDQWICYKADKNVLQANKVLSVPKYIEKNTGMEVEVDDGLFDRLVNKHKDLPENIIENLANNQSRNNLIVSEYLNNKDEYGKTLIFADRWFQCEYIAEKLNQNGVKAAALYSVVSGQSDSYTGGIGRRNDEMNRQILEDFTNDRIDVVVNVRMLTEGIDVPDIKTAMITRQTTSNILLTQMIGRALRGEKTGGGKDKNSANIVFFYDKWRRLLPWANVVGGVESGRPATQGRNPMSLISIQLIKLATSDIEYKGFENAPFITFIPVGFWGCEYTIAIEEASIEELISFSENVVVYEFNKDKYNKMIDFLIAQELTAFAAENISTDEVREKAASVADQFFDSQNDDFDGMLIENIGNIVRHIAQNSTRPAFIDFHDRDKYDMDKLARELLYVLPLEANVILRNKFNDAGLQWGFLYKNYSYFRDAYNRAQSRIVDGTNTQTKIDDPILPSDVLDDDRKRQVYARDNFTCLCCGKAQRKGVVLNVDHIIPVSMGGSNAVSNLQTLCKQCNSQKGVNEIDYRVNINPLREPKKVLNLFKSVGSDSEENAIARIVNEFYHCKALCELHYHKRSNGHYYSVWEIVLYTGNPPEWLSSQQQELLMYVKHQLGCEHVTKIEIKN